MNKVKKFINAKALKKLREKVDPEHWTEQFTVAIVNAYYASDSNIMKFPAGILNRPYFYSKLPDYMNFGAIGTVIGHEITHGFDDQGSAQDWEGRLTDWWEKSTAKEFKKRAKCFIDQYGGYKAEQVGLNLNGINTQGENIADNGGLKAAYGAYAKFVKNKQEQKLPDLDLTPQQLFWVSYGQLWCAKYRDAELKNMIQTGKHSPGEFRTNGPLSNNRDFAKDYDCPVGSPMNPKEKCTVW